MFETIKIRTVKNGMHEITDQVREIVRKSGVQDGLCAIYCTHTTAGIVMTSCGVKETPEDIQDELRRIVPTRVDFKHQHDTPEDAAGHIKSAIVGSSITLYIEDGELYIGNTKGIYFAEFDGPRNRQVLVKTIGSR